MGGIHRVTVRVNIGFGQCNRSSSPRWNPRRVSRLAVSLQQGSFDVAFLTSVSLNASRKHPLPSFGTGSGEARCDDGRVRVVTCDVASARTNASAKVRDNAFIRLEHPASFSSGLARPIPKTRSALLRACPPKPETQSIGPSHGWLCPANTPHALLDQGVVG